MLSFGRRAQMLSCLLILFVPGFSSLAAAQLPVASPTGTVIAFSLYPDTTFRYVGLAEGTVGPNGILPKDAVFTFSFQDLSVDSPTSSTNPAYRKLEFFVDWVGGVQPGETWNLINNALGYPSLSPGEFRSGFQIIVQHEPGEKVLEAAVQVVAKLSLVNDPEVFALRNETFHVKIYPTPGIQLSVQTPPGPPLDAGPNTFVTVPLVLQNTDLYPQQIDIQVRIEASDGVTPESIPVIGSGTFLLEALEERTINVSFRTPKEKFWYNSAAMQYSIRAVNSQNEGVSQTYTSVIIVNGFYYSRQLLWIIPILVVLLVLLIFLLVAARRYYNEKVLGKPIPPWRIPQEAAHLQELRKADPREFYLLRYFFMEEEYQSALNWFHSFKRRTKKQIAQQAASARYEEKAIALAEPSLARFDRRAERLTRRYRGRQERQRLKLEAKIERLQGKLEQHHEEDFEKDHAKWESQVDKIRKKANRPWYRQHKKWEKEVAKIMADWEKPFAKDKKRADKEREKALAKYEAQVKKKDKQAWRDWREAVENAERENKIRAKEGREPIPLPQLYSREAGEPDLPPPFKAPPKPKLPPEPKEPSDVKLPPEPTMEKPVLEASHYARKTRRARRKTERKVARLERKLERALAKNERDRVRALARADRKRNKLIHKSRVVLEPTLTERVLHLTPEHREYRARRRLMKALANEKVRAVAEAEESRLELMRVDAERREAELLSKLLRDRATVRGGAAPSGMRIQPDKDPALLSLREKNQAQLARERQASHDKVRAERVRIEKELRAHLTEELIKERARSRAATAPAAEPAKPKKK